MKTKVLKLVLDGNGSYLGMEKGCFVVRDRKDNIQRFPFFENEIGEVVLKSGNLVSTGALASLGFWDIDVLILTQKGQPVAMLKGLDDDSHVKTRISQYEASKNDKGISIAKKIVASRIESQNLILRKYGLRQHYLVRIKKAVEEVNSGSVKTKLMAIEGHCSRQYFKQIFQLFPSFMRVENRKTFKAYDGLNNLFNLVYSVLKWKVYRAIVRAKLEPYLGFLHSEQWGKPSLVCDFMELYRYFVEDFLIHNSSNLKRKDFIMKSEDYSKNKIGQREYLNNPKTNDLTNRLYSYFETIVETPRMKYGKRQTIETLINEEAFLFAQYLRNEIPTWIPRISEV
ncbi:MAG: CRISPR-associated endonuclease Cas1 [Candidatus Bathyarchaeota archaeon]|nr:CRISPR-associated endonuclease Cas1 [Candidatus Bathyarchaeota archaeon]